jgi:hypothetical protein
MKISFPNGGSDAGISIRVVINALLKWHKAERAQAAHKKKNVPQVTSGWDYRPRESVRRHARIDHGGTETANAQGANYSTTNKNDDVWFDSIDPDRRSNTQGRKRRRRLTNARFRGTTKVL